MKPGGGKSKGTQFERTVCKQLSLWVSNGKSEDYFWRSSISGGRATVAQRKGKNIRAAGDICAVAPEGHELTDRFFIECKHVKTLQLDRFLFGTGMLYNFWIKAVEQAELHSRLPMLIARQNRLPVILLVPWITKLDTDATPMAAMRDIDIYRFDDVVWQEAPKPTKGERVKL